MGYVSHDFLSGDAFFANSDFQDMGLTAGYLRLELGHGARCRYVTVQIGLPKPST